ncbi:ead/Ea22-like family protein [Salmonella enterica]|nr:ead/Ea22-like family protein [Salmonella enterica]
MNKIDYQALRAKAEKATCGEWSLEYGEERFDAGDALIHREVVGYLPICRIEGAHPESGFDEDFQMEQQANAEFIAAFNPKVALALLDERERKQQYIKSRDQENEDIALTVGRLRVELEAAKKRMTEQSAIVAAAEKLVRCKGRYHSELNYRALAKLFGVITPDLPPLVHENVHYADAAEVEITALRQRIAELEARTVNLSKLSVGEVMHLSGFSRDYAEGWCAGNDNAIHEIRAAGIKVKGE